jgi:hypothetical protein
MKLLVIASSPADYVEMADIAQVLAGRGHDVWLVYLYSSSDDTARGLEQLQDLGRRTGVRGVPVEVSQVPSHIPPVETESTAAPATAAAREAPWVIESSVSADTMRSVIGWVRRRGLDWYPKNTRIARLAYGSAHVMDALRDRERSRQTWLLFRRLYPRFRELTWQTWFEGARTLHRAAAMVLHYKRFAEFIRNSINSLGLDALIIPEDIVGSTWPVAIQAAHASGTPVLVLPYTVANRAEAIQSLKGAAAFQSRANAAAAQLYPRWRFTADGVDIVRLPSDHILAHEELGITPPDPWMMNSGYADKILVDSSASRNYFTASGIPAQQIDIVGSVSQDRMFTLCRNREHALTDLRTELGLSGEKPLLLVSGCPNQLTASVPYCEFKTIEEVAAFVGRSLAPLAGRYHLVVRPHPGFAGFGPLLEPFGFVSTMRSTASLVPLADLFVAFASATIRWAIACGVPTVNYDVFHYGYGDFADAGGVRTVNRQSDFRSLVSALTPDGPAMTDLRAAAQRDSAHWSVMDGKGIDRIEAAIAQAREHLHMVMKEQQQDA